MKISIITVVRNNAKNIEDCIRSVISQTYKDKEYIVIDGRSTDGTLEIINRHRNETTTIVSEKDYGHIDAMNKGIRLATGDILGFLHSDDFYANPEVIEKIANIFKKNNVDSVYGDLIYVGRNNPNKVIRYWKSGKFNIEKIENGWMPPHPSFFVKKKIYKKYGLLNSTDFKISMDYELILRFLYRYRISIAYLPEAVVKMRCGGLSNRSIGNILAKTKEDLKACRMYGLGPATVFKKNISKVPQFFVRKMPF